MIIFLYGPDSYRRLERKNFYAEQFFKKYGLPPQPADLNEAGGWALFEETAKGQSLFAPRKLILLEGLASADPKKLKPILELFLDNKLSNLVISESKKPVKALEMLLKKPVLAEEFETLKDSAWLSFLRAEAKKFGAALDAAALTYLASAYKGDSWSAVTELKKISNLGRTCMAKDLEEMGVAREADYWALVNGLRAPRIGGRLTALQAIMSMQEPAAKVFNILASLWSQRARDFAEYDKAIKFGRMDYEEALTDLALS